MLAVKHKRWCIEALGEHSDGLTAKLEFFFKEGKKDFQIICKIVKEEEWFEEKSLKIKCLLVRNIDLLACVSAL